MSRCLHERLGPRNGFGLIEIIIAIALYLTIATFSISAVVGSFSSNRLAEEQAQATFYARQGLEAARSIRNQGWDTPFLATDCSTGCGISSAGDFWSWLGSSTTYGAYELSVVVNPVERDGSNIIVESGGTDDPDTKRVVSTVSWDFTPTRQNTVELVTYLTNFRKAIATLGDWTQSIIRSSVDMGGGQDALKVQYHNGYAFIIRNSNTDSFSVYNTTDPDAPQQISTLGIAGSSLRNVFMNADYAYLADGQNGSEVTVVSVADATNPAVINTVDLSGNGDANGVYAVGSTLYVSRSSHAKNPTFHVLNISNPANVVEIGSTALGGDGMEVVVSGNYAYVASTNNSQELQVVSVANPSSPTQVASLNLPGNADAETIALFGSYAVVGQGNFLRVIDIANPTSPVLVASLDLGGSVHDLSLNAAGAQYLFAATENASAEFQIIDMSVVNTPVIAHTIDIQGNNAYYGVAYSPDFDQAIAVGNSNTDEIVLFTPN